MKRHSKLVVVLAIGLIGVAGCGRSAPSSGTSATAQTVSAGPATGEITVWAMGDEGKNLSQLVSGFVKENPQAKVNVTPVPWDAAHDKISAAIASGKTPDISLIGTTWMGEFAKSGGLDPTPASIDKSQFFPSAWASTNVNGTAYGVPWYSDTRCLFYRKDLAERAGVAPPKTWDELKSFARALKEKAGVTEGLNLPAGDKGAWQTFLPFAWDAGADLLGPDQKFTLDTPQMRQAIDYYNSFFAEGLSSNIKPLDGALESGFIDGKIGSFISYPAEQGNLAKLAGPEFASKYAVVPRPTGTMSSGFAGGADLAVFKTAKNRDAAWKFVQYLSKPDVQANWFGIQGDLPSVQAAWQDPKLTSNPNLQAFGTQLKVAKAPPAIVNWEQIASVLDSELEKVTRTGQSSAEATKNMQSKASAIGTGS
jgi:multiple sugar transport system substrate-binding protein